MSTNRKAIWKQSRVRSLPLGLSDRVTLANYLGISIKSIRPSFSLCYHLYIYLQIYSIGIDTWCSKAYLTNEKKNHTWFLDHAMFSFVNLKLKLHFWWLKKVGFNKKWNKLSIIIFNLKCQSFFFFFLNVIWANGKSIKPNCLTSSYLNFHW